jgi:hypothetical protein
VVQAIGKPAVLLLVNVRFNDYLERRNGCEPVAQEEFREVKEKWLGLDADAVGRAQDINAFSVCLLAR